MKSHPLARVAFSFGYCDQNKNAPGLVSLLRTEHQGEIFTSFLRASSCALPYLFRAFAFLRNASQ